MTTPANPQPSAPAASGDAGGSALNRLWTVNRGRLLAVAIAAIAYAVAVGGALFVRASAGGDDGGGIDSVNQFVESISGVSNIGISSVGLKLGYAYAVGAASAVNPCGFAMLPAYLGLYVGGGAAGPERRHPAMLLLRALLVGLTVSLGFVALFGLVGLILLGPQAAVAAVLPWFGLAIGILLIGAGAFMAAGGKIYTSLAQRLAHRIGDPSQQNLPGYFLFGVSYGLASLSCTLPLFIAVIGVGAGLSTGWLDTLAQFLLYAAGMGSVIMLLTIGMAVARTVLVRWLRKALPYVGIAGAWLMVIAGTYIVFYWLTLGELL